MQGVGVGWMELGAGAPGSQLAPARLAGGRWGRRVVTAGPKDPLRLPGLGRNPGARGGRGHSPRPLPHLPCPEPPGIKKRV